jgi:AcrR family transcriptional regulator
MARIDKGALTRLEIVAEASKQFLEKGYSHTTVSSIAKELEMSKGNLTFYYPTKEHLLAELTDLLCTFHWQQMKKEADDGISSIMAICLELTAMAGACEDDEIIRDFFISSYTSPLCLAEIRKNDAARAKQVFREYRPDWRDEQFEEAELLVSGVEYATLMTAGADVALETRIAGALNIILGIYGIPGEVRDSKVKRVFAMDYRGISRNLFLGFRTFIDEVTEESLREAMEEKRRKRAATSPPRAAENE